ncbi:MAG: Txe/YoeB family addiction module toxin [Holophagaceae bacterium]|nr:Txe/YoeB family addiction module toxin [Holophagaceae bacterium]
MPYTVKLGPKAEADYAYWEKHNPGNADRIDELLVDIERDPFKGKGKPEPLKHDLHGYWSRQITQRHRLLYMVKNDLVIVHRCFGHYE